MKYSSPFGLFNTKPLLLELGPCQLCRFEYTFFDATYKELIVTPVLWHQHCTCFVLALDRVLIVSLKLDECVALSVSAVSSESKSLSFLRYIFIRVNLLLRHKITLFLKTTHNRTLIKTNKRAVGLASRRSHHKTI